MVKLIGITGKAGAGKDSAADVLVANGFVRYSLASPLKRGLNSIFGWNMDMWEDRDWKERVIADIGKSPRQLAQTLGTEWGRALVNQDLWLILAERFIASSSMPVVIPDVRFQNEADLIKRLGGTLLEIRRPGVDAVSAHASEAGVEGADFVVVNKGSLHTLQGVIRVSLEKGLI